MSLVKSSQTLRRESNDRTATRSSGPSESRNRRVSISIRMRPTIRARVEVLLEEEDDQPGRAALGFAEARRCPDAAGAAGSGAVGALLRVPDPHRRFHPGRLAVDPDLEVAGVQVPDRLAARIDDPGVDQDSRDGDASRCGGEAAGPGRAAGRRDRPTPRPRRRGPFWLRGFGLPLTIRPRRDTGWSSGLPAGPRPACRPRAGPARRPGADRGPPRARGAPRARRPPGSR